MKKAILFIVGSCLTGLVLVIVLFLLITLCPKGKFSDSYMATIRTKYEILKETNDPKIIVVAGSSSAYGLDNALLEKGTGYKVANTALHAGTGALFELELSKANINKGDIVLLAFEFGWPYSRTFDTVNLELIMAGIDDEIEMYKYFPKSKYLDVIGYLPIYASKKNAYNGGANGVYARSAFDETGNMIFPRADSPIVEIYAAAPQKSGSVDIKDVMIEPDVVELLIDYKNFVNKRGAEVYWIGCPVYEKAVKCDASCFEDLMQQLYEKTGIQCISNQADYLFPGDKMYNTIYHCNSVGARYRTELLINDLKKANLTK